MLNVQNNKVLFCRLYFICFIFSANSFYFLSKAEASVSTQQCEQELMIYCPSGKFNSSELKKQCVRDRQDLFTGNCVDKILGPTAQRHDDDANKNTKDLITNNINELELENQEYKKNAEDKNKQIEQQSSQISTLTEVLLRKNCISEIVKFCKTKTRRRQVVLKESLDDCIDKMIKNDRYLTINCQNVLLNIITQTSEQQYGVYNIGCINVKLGPNLKKIRKKQKTKQAS